MKNSLAPIAVLALLAFGSLAYSQEHHSQQTKQTSQPKEKEREAAIFCPTMKTGQLCSHGTTTILQLQGQQAEQWIALARKYNKAVDEATLQLFKDAEGTLTASQLELLKAWFAVGLNPQINELLFGKGLGPAEAKHSAH